LDAKTHIAGTLNFNLRRQPAMLGFLNGE
jgi:hypothetical protein